MANFDRRDIAGLFHRNSQVDRAQIFGVNDPRPLHLLADSELMFPGYVGMRYKPGGPVFLAINPGGGGDAYQRRSPEDEQFYPLLQAFRASDPSRAFDLFEQINVAFSQVVAHWNLMRILEPVADAAGATLAEIAYLNAVPYRTHGDKVPSVGAKLNAWRLLTGPAIQALQPGCVIALGMKAGDVLERVPPFSANSFIVPRTIGDSYVSDAARTVIGRIAATTRGTIGTR